MRLRGLAMMMVLICARAQADALKIQYRTTVSEGQKPSVVLTATEPIARLSINVVRDDGQTFSGSFAPVAAGESHAITLGGDPGRHTYKARVTTQVGGATQESTLSFEAMVASAFVVKIEKAEVDLVRRRFVLRMSHPAGKVELTVLSSRPGTAAQVHDVSFAGHPAGDPLVLTWEPIDGDVARIDVKAYDADGFFQGVSIVPWNVFIPHEEVTFATDKADVAPSEIGKLDASYRTITAAVTAHQDLGAIKLFVAGHTDTVGEAAYNFALSQARARAIASYFRKRGLRIPIAFEGFGESSLKVATADGQDEPRNRRVDYILAVEEPALATRGFHAAWKWLK